MPGEIGWTPYARLGRKSEQSERMSNRAGDPRIIPFTVEAVHSMHLPQRMPWIRRKSWMAAIALVLRLELMWRRPQ